MTVTVACSAMAARTMLDEKGLPTGKIGHSGWSERDRIGFEQIAGATMGKIRNLAWSAFGGNDRLKPCRPLYKLGAFRRWWQRGVTCGDRGTELCLLGIFGHIGRAHVCTPVTDAPLVCRLLLEKKQTTPPINLLLS